MFDRGHTFLQYDVRFLVNRGLHPIKPVIDALEAPVVRLEPLIDSVEPLIDSVEPLLDYGSELGDRPFNIRFSLFVHGRRILASSVAMEISKDKASAILKRDQRRYRNCPTLIARQWQFLPSTLVRAARQEAEPSLRCASTRQERDVRPRRCYARS
ncbi:MAG: hypothetical protein AUF76_15835 [Acidobacteria bacterium 13_1_20CM_2_65_9]|nr:MAG: hypothetical protein AUF76_15835 [Acidobacteria bacterium 13_1_20CM_2_65_9]